MYMMLNTHPDLAYTLSRLSQYLTNLTDVYWRVLKRVLHYVKRTLHYSITYRELSTRDLHGYTDSDWAGNKETRSTGGYVFQLGNRLISWKSKLQPTVTLLSCEAEYMAATQATKEVVWLQRLLAHLGQLNSDLTELTLLYCDNQGAIQVSQNLMHHKHMKHINIQYHYVWEKAEDNKILLTYIPTADMMADSLTKLLGLIKFGRFVQQLGLDGVVAGQD